MKNKQKYVVDVLSNYCQEIGEPLIEVEKTWIYKAIKYRETRKLLFSSGIIFVFVTIFLLRNDFTTNRLLRDGMMYVSIAIASFNLYKIYYYIRYRAELLLADSIRCGAIYIMLYKHNLGDANRKNNMIKMFDLAKHKNVEGFLEQASL